MESDLAIARLSQNIVVAAFVHGLVVRHAIGVNTTTLVVDSSVFLLDFVKALFSAPVWSDSPSIVIAKRSVFLRVCWLYCQLE